MPGRTFSGLSYRYGFNGKENDNEAKTDANNMPILGSQQDYGLRIYDPRLGKFLSKDPLTKSYPWYTPYQFAGNTPIQAIDLDGAEEYHYVRLKDKDGKTVLALIETKDIIDHVSVLSGTSPTTGAPTYYDKTVKNQRKEYYVHQESEIIYDNGSYTYEYNEENEYDTYEKAAASTDEDFNGTSEDFWAQPGGAFCYYFSQGGSYSANILLPTKRLIRQLHHSIPKGLKNTNAFVKKAIKGGFKMDGVANLTPLERFCKKTNTGVHAKHMKYTAQIAKHLEALDLSKFNDADAKNYLMQLNDYIIGKIKANPNTKLNDLQLDLDKFVFKPDSK